MAGLGDGRVIAAVYDGSGSLKAIVWDLSSAGDFTRKGDASAADGSRPSGATLTARRLVLALRDGTRKLDMSTWSLTP